MGRRIIRLVKGGEAVIKSDFQNNNKESVNNMNINMKGGDNAKRCRQLRYV